MTLTAQNITDRLIKIIKDAEDLRCTINHDGVASDDETHQRQLNAIMEISLCNSIESFNKRVLLPESKYWTPAYQYVANAIQREIDLTKVIRSKNAEISKLLKIPTRRLEEQQTTAATAPPTGH